MGGSGAGTPITETGAREGHPGGGWTRRAGDTRETACGGDS